jgi:hypothetical protein
VRCKDFDTDTNFVTTLTLIPLLPSGWLQSI